MRSDWWKFNESMTSGTRPPVRYIRRGEEGVRASDLGPSENQARQKHDSDSDVVPESYQIQDFLKLRNNSTRRNAIPPKYVNVIYEFCLARQKHDV